MTIQQVAARVEKFAVDNSPLILTSIGVAGVVSTAVLTGKATIKAVVLDRDYEEMYPKKIEYVKRYWKLYVPAVTSAGFTVVAIVGANRIGTRRAAAMAAAYSLSEKAFEEYREKVVEKFSAGKEQEIRDEVAQDRVNRNPVGPNEVVITDGGDVLCYDTATGRYFRSDMETLKKAQNDLNYMILNNFYASQNDFYDKIGLERIPSGDEVGWNSGDMLELEFSTTMSLDQKPCIAITFRTAPVRDYFRAH